MKQSAGIVLYRMVKNHMEFLLVHPGGPYWKNKDQGAWTIPKGELNEDEDALDAAKREVLEETGIRCEGNFLQLEPVKQKGGKLVYAWALEKDIDPAIISSNDFEIEWPPRSGKMKQFPEIDQARWFDIHEARIKINPHQADLIDQLLNKLDLLE